jgi:hypothetical protein
MSKTDTDLITEIDAFLRDVGISPSYFGKKACGNSELVERLRAGRPILNQTEKKVREFMAAERRKRREAA